MAAAAKPPPVAPQVTKTSDCVLSGTLYKNKSGFNRLSKVVQSWDARFFVLNDTVLSYYESEKDTEARAVFPLAAANVKRVRRTLCSLMLKLPKRTLLLKAVNEETIVQWHKAILAAITKARGGQPPPEIADEEEDIHDEGAGVSANSSKRTSHDSGGSHRSGEEEESHSSRGFFSKLKPGKHKDKDVPASPGSDGQPGPAKGPPPLQQGTVEAIPKAAGAAVLTSGSEEETGSQGWAGRPADGPAPGRRAPSTRTTSKPFHFFEEESHAIDAAGAGGPKSPQLQAAQGPDIRDALAKGSFRGPAAKPPLPPAGSAGRRPAGAEAGDGAGEATRVRSLHIDDLEDDEGETRLPAGGRSPSKPPASPLRSPATGPAAAPAGSPNGARAPSTSGGQPAIVPDKNWVEEEWDDEADEEAKPESPPKRPPGKHHHHAPKPPDGGVQPDKDWVDANWDSDED